MKSLLNIGTALTKAEQQSINGGKSKCDLNCLWILDLVNCKCISRPLD